MLRANYRNQLMWLVDLMPKLFPEVTFQQKSIVNGGVLPCRHWRGVDTRILY